MKVLALGDEHGMHSALQQLQSTRDESIEVITRNWTSFTAQELTQCQPDCIVFLLLLSAQATAAEHLNYKQLVLAAGNYAKQRNLPLLMLSTAAVFDGARIAYKETDQCSPNSDYGRFYADLEQQLLTLHDNSIIVRVAWLYSAQPHSFLAYVISFAEQNKCIRINSAAKANPTSTEDVARVFQGIILQLQQGADNWGIFHYVAADTALGFQFVEAILQQASQYQTAINPKQLCFEHQEQADTEFDFPAVVLKCQRLRGNFGIHQRSWRALMPAVVREYYGID